MTTRIVLTYLFLTILTILIGHRAHAAGSGIYVKGDITFTAEEKARHLANVSKILSVTTESMKAFAKNHYAIHQQCGLGLLYGFKSDFAKANRSAREHFLVSKATCANPPRVDDVSITSCEMFTNRHLEVGFASVGEQDLFAKVTNFFEANGRSGIALAYALRQLGWNVVYWNTDAPSRHPSPADRKKMGQNPEDHVVTYSIAKKQRSYYDVPLDGMMINFAPEHGSKTKLDRKGIEAVKRSPYFIGVAHGGFHVFPGTFGTVIESHSPYNPDVVKNIEVGEFDPPLKSPNGLRVKENGAVRMAYYYSGIMILPPGQLDSSLRGPW